MTETAEVSPADLTRLLGRHRFRHATEKELQAGITEVLSVAGIAFEREVTVHPGDCIDFLLLGGLGIEVKTGGGLSEVTRQIGRYAATEAVSSLVLVTTLSRLANLPDSIAGKPLAAIILSRWGALKYLSVCSGIEAATLAWHPLGWEPVAFSEVDAFPSAVLAHRYPHVRNLRDFTQIRNRWLRRIGIEPGTTDVLVAGTPCQSFSVAGLRGGMADARGNLALGFLQLARRVRPRWIVWENVPGVLSSTSHDAPDPCPPPPPMDMGRDGQEMETEDEYESKELHAFNSFLAGLSELGYGWAYRILDARHFGVPQRRRRVFVVGYLGDWRPPAAVLFERDSLSRHSPPGRKTRADITSSLTRGPGSGGPDDGRAQAGHLIAAGVAPPLTSNPYGDHESREGLIVGGKPEVFRDSGSSNWGPGVGTLTAHDAKDGYGSGLIAHTLRGDGFDASEDGTGRGTPLVVAAIRERAVCENSDAGPDGAGFRTDGMAYTLETRSVPQAVAYRTNAAGQVDAQGDKAASLTTMTDPSSQFVAYQCQGTNVGEMGTLRKGNGNETGGVPFIVNAAESCAVQSHARQSEIARCLDSTGSFASAQGGTVVAEAYNVQAQFSEGNGPHARRDNISKCLDSHGLNPDCQQGGTVVATFDERNITSGENRSRVEPGQPCHTLHADPPRLIGTAVRRLTPIECERLMGMPDDYTLVPYRGKPAKDGPRYKAIGNSMAVPVVAWIGKRIQMIETYLQTRKPR